MALNVIDLFGIRARTPITPLTAKTLSTMTVPQFAEYKNQSEASAKQSQALAGTCVFLLRCPPKKGRK